jgi:hypothetical protein
MLGAAAVAAAALAAMAAVISAATDRSRVHYYCSAHHRRC